MTKRKRLKIIIAVISVLVLILVVVNLKGFKFNGAPLYSGKDIQAESHKLFYGSWLLNPPRYGQNEGFTLNPDSTASSFNRIPLLYKKWRIEKNKLILTLINLGNYTASVEERKYTIEAFDENKIFLKKDGEDFHYKKSETTLKPDSLDMASLNSSFDYFPTDVNDISNPKAFKHPIDFDSNIKAKQFESAISTGYKTGKLNFAEHYVVITWGCGVSCLDGVMVDARDGKIYNLPSKKGYSDIGNALESKLNSILLLTSFTTTTEPHEVEKNYWVWNETSKEFMSYKSEVVTSEK